MKEIVHYKIAWNTKSDDGIFILETTEGIHQVLVDSAAEAQMLLTKLRHEGNVYFDRAVVHVANEALEFPKPVSHEYVMPEGVEVIAQQVSWVIPEKEKVTPVAVASKATPTKAKETKKKKSTSKPKSKTIKATTDKLRLIEGIGPKIEGLLHDAGILSFNDLAKAKQAILKGILDKAGSRYRMHDPGTWSEQAAMAAAGKMVELKKWQDELKGGKKAKK